jgi:hypothetical protein
MRAGGLVFGRWYCASRMPATSKNPVPSGQEGSGTIKDTLKRPITTLQPSMTTTHHDGGLPSPSSYTLAEDNPPLTSTPTQHLQTNIREGHQFQNDGWTKWEAVQLVENWKQMSYGKG